jgi:uncharacterized protein with HEPN domain
MTRHDDAAYIGQMIDAAGEAVGYVKNVTFEEFVGDTMRQRAVIYVLQMIGESARRVSADGKDRLHDIPWAQIIGMRHRLVHDYLDVDIDLVWKTVIENVPELVRSLESAMRDLQTNGPSGPTT